MKTENHQPLRLQHQQQQPSKNCGCVALIWNVWNVSKILVITYKYTKIKNIYIGVESQVYQVFQYNFYAIINNIYIYRQIVYE